MREAVRPQEVLEFWFSEPARSHWFDVTADLDAAIRSRFLTLWEAAAREELDWWADTASGALALVIVLDQFPLNMFRGRAESWSTEAAARRITRQALARGADSELPAEGKAFLYMPLMHSEDLGDQQWSVRLYEAAGLTENLKWARHHCELIRRFGRFPHRNAVLGRKSTDEEMAYLASGTAFLG